MTKILYGNIVSQLKTLRIGVYPFVMYLSKHSCLTTEINDKIQYVVESGLIEKWTADYKETRFSNSDRLDKNTPRTLNIAQLLGVFQLYCLLLIVATISFVVEIVNS